MAIKHTHTHTLTHTLTHTHACIRKVEKRDVFQAIENVSHLWEDGSLSRKRKVG